MKIIVTGSQHEAVEGQPDSFKRWTLDDGTVINLLTLPELNELKKNSPDALLTSITGDTEIARKCDDDIRYGYVAFGFPEVLK